MGKGCTENDAYHIVNSLYKDKWWEMIASPFLRLRYWLEEKRDQHRYRRQRAKRGYSDYDQWAMQDWFIRTARPMLQTLSERTYHYPEEVTEEQWREILVEMAQLLEIMTPWEDAAARKQLMIPREARGPEIYRRIDEEKRRAKARFFFLFDKWFYDL